MPRKELTLSIEDAKRRATMNSLVPYRRKGKGLLGFVHTPGASQIQLSWGKLEEYLKKENMIICDYGGIMKIIARSWVDK
jgi:hypothetical protein